MVARDQKNRRNLAEDPQQPGGGQQIFAVGAYRIAGHYNQIGRDHPDHIGKIPAAFAEHPAMQVGHLQQPDRLGQRQRPHGQMIAGAAKAPVAAVFPGGERRQTESGGAPGGSGQRFVHSDSSVLR